MIDSDPSEIIIRLNTAEGNPTSISDSSLELTLNEKNKVLTQFVHDRRNIRIKGISYFLIRVTPVFSGKLFFDAVYKISSYNKPD